MDFNKLSRQAASFMSSQNASSNQAAADPNADANTGAAASSSNANDTSNTAGTGNMGANSGAAGANPASDTANEDYGDKGLDFIEKKTGHTLSREQNEKITDGARGLFEKVTGKKVDSKFSN